MTPDFAINPFDTQLGNRYPTPQERSFLVNFITLLATPVGAEKPYDGITDMAGMVVDELYSEQADSGNPKNYTPARRVLAALFPSGSAAKMIEERMADVREKEGLGDEEARGGVIDRLVNEIIAAYTINPDVKRLS